MRPGSATDHGSDTVTDGIRVVVVPTFLAAHSDRSASKYVFAYSISIANGGARTARLRSRHWIIVDADGERQDVRGPGVVGQHPTLAPGERFDYSSFCPLQTSWGTMEGSFEFEREDGSVFSVTVGRFYLVAPRA